MNIGEEGEEIIVVPMPEKPGKPEVVPEPVHEPVKVPEGVPA